MGTSIERGGGGCLLSVLAWENRLERGGVDFRLQSAVPWERAIGEGGNSFCLQIELSCKHRLEGAAQVFVHDLGWRGRAIGNGCSRFLFTT